jgi:hypothetical protein
MTEGDIHDDGALRAEGLARGRAAIQRWPEFNWFTVGYVLSARPDTSALFREGLEMQWRTVEECSHAAIDRANPTARVALAAEATETDSLKRRACWNSWVAPHNVEGFFLNMGDMLVKAGDWRTGQKVYAIATAVPSFRTWPFRDTLEARIADAERNVAAFRVREARGSAPAPGEAPRRMMLRSTFACTGCHMAGAP